MTQDPISSLIAIIGVACQAAAATLLSLLFFLLRRYAMRRTYFLIWGNAWVLLAVALIALTVRYFGFRGSDGIWADSANFLYQLAKLLAMTMLLAGTLGFTRGLQDRISAPLYAAAAGYVIITFTFAHTLMALMMAQAPVVAAISLGCAWLLFNLPESRRSLGSGMSGLIFAAITVLWAVYPLAFHAQAHPENAPPVWIVWIAHYSGYFDLFLDVLLAFGMVLILLEDVKRETDAAHTELGEAHSALLEEALRDSLTRVLNRRAFNEGAGMEHIGREGGCVVVFDLDNLKQVNDEHGHLSGDALLKHFVEVLTPQLRRSDALYRFGGDEFLLIVARARASEVVPRLLTTFQSAAPLQLGDSGSGVRLQVSLGAAEFNGRADLDHAVSRADSEMYEHKRRRKPLAGDELPQLT